MKIVDSHPLVTRWWIKRRRQLKYSHLHNSRTSHLHNVQTIEQSENALFRCVFHPFLPFFLHLHPFHAHIKPILKKNQSWLGFFVRGGGSNILPELREGRHRLLNWQIQKTKYENKSQLSRAIYYLGPPHPVCPIFQKKNYPHFFGWEMHL